MRYFTSDWHLGSNAVLKTAKRPFADATDASEKIFENCVSTVKSKTSGYSTIFHIGDFALRNSDKHYRQEEDKADFKVDVVNIKSNLLVNYGIGLVLLKGNHDDGHNFNSDIDTMVVDFSHSYGHIRVAHYPTTYGNYKFAICGHVHDAWLVKRINGIVNINVGIDVWDYKPVSENELIDLMKTIDYINFECDFTIKDMKQLIKLKKRRKSEIGMYKRIKSSLKNEKKGLTAEECERRKIEAMKAKGLI